VEVYLYSLLHVYGMHGYNFTIRFLNHTPLPLVLTGINIVLWAVLSTVMNHRIL
jgi:hypothetical protein